MSTVSLASLQNLPVQITYKAVDEGLVEGKFISPDLGGTASTEEVLQDVIKRL